MNFIIDNILTYKYVYIGLLALLLLIIILIIVLKPKKIKPIEARVDDEPKNNEKTEIEQVIEALEDNSEKRPMTTFEEEQEANAIISYQELVQAVNEKKARLEKDAPKKLDPEVPAELLENVEEKPEEPPKFKNSEFISPIFGKDSNNDNFLKELKDFRNNL